MTGNDIGWTMLGKTPNSTVDVVNGFKTFKELYLSVAPTYQGMDLCPELTLQ